MEKITEKKDVYCFEKLPANIRQIGEMTDGRRIYFEDFVVTYRDKALKESLEEKMVFFIGKKGKGEAQDALFVYGAIEISWHLLDGAKGLKALLAKKEEEWKDYFPKGELCGWGCGVDLWNSQTRSKVQEIHEVIFDEKDTIFYCMEHSEEQEEIYRHMKGHFYRMPGYMIYYGKNPQMQEYMLRGNKKQSFEDDYEDLVTKNMRQVIIEKEEKGEVSKKVLLTTGLVIGILCGIGVAMVCKSNAQMKSLQETMVQVSSQEREAKEGEQVKEKAEQGEESASGETEQPTVSVEPVQEQATEIPEETAGTEQNGQTVRQEATEQQINVKEEQNGNTKESEVVKETTSKPKSQTKQQLKSQTKQQSKSQTKQQSKSQTNQQSKSQTNQQTKTSTQSSKKSDCWYRVKKGDTLSEIVWRQYRDKKYISIVKQVNHIADENAIKAGDRLRLPAR